MTSVFGQHGYELRITKKEKRGSVSADLRLIGPFYSQRTWGWSKRSPKSLARRNKNKLCNTSVLSPAALTMTFVLWTEQAVNSDVLQIYYLQTWFPDHTRANTKERSLALTLKINGVWPQTSPTPLPNSISLFQHLKWQRVATQSLCTVMLCLYELKDFLSNPRNAVCMMAEIITLTSRQLLCVRGFLFMCSLVSAWCGTSFMMDSRPFACSVSHSDSSQNNLER